MKKYIGTKVVQAMHCRLHDFIKETGRNPYPNEPDKPNVMGFKVKYKDGYISWSPADVFLEAYSEAHHLTFGNALEALKKGHKVARKGWNGKDMFLWLKPATIVEESWCKDPLLKELARTNGGRIPALGTICMYTHDATGRRAILTGWVASQSDMLSEDWFIVNEE